MRIVGMYHISEEVNTFAQICFPAKIEAPCLRGLGIHYSYMQSFRARDSAFIVLLSQPSKKDGSVFLLVDS